MPPPEFSNRTSVSDNSALAAGSADNHDMKNNSSETETTREIFLADLRTPGQTSRQLFSSSKTANASLELAQNTGPPQSETTASEETTPGQISPEGSNSNEFVCDDLEFSEATAQADLEATSSDTTTPNVTDQQVIARVGKTILPGLLPVIRVARILPQLLNVPSPPPPQVPGEKLATAPSGEAAATAQSTAAQAAPELISTGLTILRTKDGQLVVPLDQLSKVTNGTSPMATVALPVQPYYANPASYQSQFQGQQFAPTPASYAWQAQPQPYSGSPIIGQPGVPLPSMPGQPANPGIPQTNLAPSNRPFAPVYPTPPGYSYPQYGMNPMNQVAMLETMAIQQRMMQSNPLHNRGNSGMLGPTGLWNPINPFSLTSPFSPISPFNQSSIWNNGNPGYATDANGNQIPINQNGGNQPYNGNGGYPYNGGGGYGGMSGMQTLMALGLLGSELAYLDNGGLGTGGTGGTGSRTSGAGGATGDRTGKVTGDSTNTLPPVAPMPHHDETKPKPTPTPEPKPEPEPKPKPEPKPRPRPRPRPGPRPPDDPRPGPHL